MELMEKFEVKYKDKHSQTQRTKLLEALKNLYINLDDYDIIKRNDSNDQTARFMDKFFITKGDIIPLLEDYAFNLNVTEYGDILADRDRPNNLLYILYIPNAKIGNWESSKSREKLLYIKWNPINKKIISFHTMKKVQDTNRDELTESKNMGIQKVIDFIYTHTTDDYIIVDVSILEELNDCLKSKEKPTYSFAEIKAIIDDVIHTISLNDEQKETLNDFVAELDSTFYHGDKIEEKLSLQQIRSRDIYSKNAHVNKFYSIRKDLIGTPNKNIKFISSQLNEDGTADFLFQTVVTPYDDPNHIYKSLTDAPIANEINQGSMDVDYSGEYMMCIRINDFWDLIEALEVIEKNEFDKNTLSSIIDLSEDVKYSCSCVSFIYTGISYYATLEDASLIPNTIAPKVWNKYRDGALCCKHLSGLFRSLSFFIPQCAMSIKKNMKDQGLLD